MESFPTWKLAVEAKGKKDVGDTRPKSRTLFPVYFEDWLPTYSGRTTRGLSDSTRPEYERPIRKWTLDRWATLRMGDIDAQDVKRLYAEMRAAGATTSEIKKTRAALSVLFATAVEDGEAITNPVLRVRVPAAPDTQALEDEANDERKKALTRRELKRFLAALPPDRLLFFEFLTQTGLRISEAIGLRWEHLDLGEEPRVLVREQLYKGRRKRLKTDNGKRDLPLSPRLTSRLLELRRDRYGGPKSPVFTTTTGTELSASNVYRRVLVPTAIRVGLKVEIEDDDGEIQIKSAISFHSFRHTCASLLFAADQNIKQVQKWLGHADPAFTLRTYVHLLDEGLGTAVFFDRAIGTPGREPRSTPGQQNSAQQPKTQRPPRGPKTAFESKKAE